MRAYSKKLTNDCYAWIILLERIQSKDVPDANVLCTLFVVKHQILLNILYIILIQINRTQNMWFPHFQEINFHERKSKEMVALVVKCESSVKTHSFTCRRTRCLFLVAYNPKFEV